MALRLDSNVRDATPYYSADARQGPQARGRIRQFCISTSISFIFRFLRMADCTVTTLHGRQDLPDLKPLKQTPKVKVFLIS